MQYRESWLCLDSSKMGDYMRCPRYYFYRHVVGWQQAWPNLDLIFGEAWHILREHMIIHGDTRESIEAGMVKFIDCYRKSFSELTDLDHQAKSPGNALLAVMEYRQEYGEFGKEFKLLHINGKPATEIYGTVPISNDRVIHFKIDAILQRVRDNMLVIMDHKTSGNDNPVYDAVWNVCNQFSIYYHAANCMAGMFDMTPNDIYGLIVDKAILRKPKAEKGKGNKFIRIPIRKSIPIINEWLWTVNRWYDLIEHDVEKLQTCKPEDHVMECFQKNDKGCIAYNKKCPYYDFCIGWANPLSRVDTCQDGFVVDFWDPAVIEEGADNVVRV